MSTADAANGLDSLRQMYEPVSLLANLQDFGTSLAIALLAALLIMLFIRWDTSREIVVPGYRKTRLVRDLIERWEKLDEDRKFTLSTERAIVLAGAVIGFGIFAGFCVQTLGGLIGDIIASFSFKVS